MFIGIPSISNLLYCAERILVFFSEGSSVIAHHSLIYPTAEEMITCRVVFTLVIVCCPGPGLKLNLEALFYDVDKRLHAFSNTSA